VQRWNCVTAGLKQTGSCILELVDSVRNIQSLSRIIFSNQRKNEIMVTGDVPSRGYVAEAQNAQIMTIKDPSSYLRVVSPDRRGFQYMVHIQVIK
jgi:hypothetical protein